MTATLRELNELPEMRQVTLCELDVPDCVVRNVELCVSTPVHFQKDVLYCVTWLRSYYDPALDNLIRRAYQDGVAGLMFVRPGSADTAQICPTHLAEMSRRLGIAVLLCPEGQFSQVWSAIVARLASDEFTRLQQWRDTVKGLSTAAAKFVSVDEFMQTAGLDLGYDLQWNAQPSAKHESVPVRVNDSVIGHLIHSGLGEKTEVTRDLLQVVGQLAAAVHLVDLTKSQSRSHHHSDLLQIMLNERSDADTIIKIAHRAKLDSNVRTWVIAFAARGRMQDGHSSALWDSLLEEAHQQLERQKILCLSGYFSGYPTLLVQDRPGRHSTESEEWLDAIVGAVVPANAIAGVSNSHSLGTGLADGFKEAMEAVVVGRALEKPERLVHSASLGRDRLFYALLTSPFAQWVTRALLQPVIDSDQSHRTDYLRTLAAYMQHDRKLLDTARALNLHRNSLRYRLSNIEQLVGVQLDDPEQAFLLQLAVLSYRAHGFAAPLSIHNDDLQW